jgi:hypothetical protein
VAVNNSPVSLNTTVKFSNSFAIVITNNSSQPVLQAQIAFASYLSGLTSPDTATNVIPLFNNASLIFAEGNVSVSGIQWVATYNGYLPAGTSVTLTVNSSITVANAESVYMVISNPAINVTMY